MDYEQLIKDFRAGKLKGWTLVMDNDGGYLCHEDDDIDDEQSEAMTEKYGQPDGYRDIVEVLKAAGVSAEWV